MPATKRLVLDLPEDVVTAIEEDVASGRYADASDAVTAAVLDRSAAARAWEHSPDFQAWIAEAAEIDRRMETGEEAGIPAEQVFAELRAELQAMQNAELQRG